jgi:hypothetical protein
VVFLGEFLRGNARVPLRGLALAQLDVPFAGRTRPSLLDGSQRAVLSREHLSLHQHLRTP